jgi:hypothetical protein
MPVHSRRFTRERFHLRFKETNTTLRSGSLTLLERANEREEIKENWRKRKREWVRGSGG